MLTPSLRSDHDELPLLEVPDLASLCAEVGWPFEAREGGTVAVDLGIPGAYCPALIATRTDAVSIVLEIVALPEAPGIRRVALVEFLQRASRVFRIGRAVVAGSPPQAHLEVVLPRVPDADELGESLAALAVAARHCAREARLIAADEAIARLFLKRSGMLPLPK